MHYGVEEMFFILSGTPAVRTPEGAEPLAPGDVVYFPEGRDGLHTFSNPTDEPVRSLASRPSGSRISSPTRSGELPGWRRAILNAPCPRAAMKESSLGSSWHGTTDVARLFRADGFRAGSTPAYDHSPRASAPKRSWSMACVKASAWRCTRLPLRVCRAPKNPRHSQRPVLFGQMSQTLSPYASTAMLQADGSAGTREVSKQPPAHSRGRSCLYLNRRPHHAMEAGCRHLGSTTLDVVAADSRRRA